MKTNLLPDAVPSAPTTPAWLRIDAAACLPFHLRATGCGLCADTCTHGAIRVDEAGPRVGESCTGCGRCVPACPMGAIEAPAFPSVDKALAPMARQTDGVIRVECRRVPASRLADGTLQLPCLGGLKPDWLISANAAIGVGPLLIDRGLCSRCPDSPATALAVDGFAAQASLGRARDLLESMGVAPSCLPRRVEDILPELAPGSSAPPAAPAEVLGRRGFLGRLGRRAGQHLLGVSEPEGYGALAAIAPGHPARPSRARIGLLAACIGLARARRLPMPFGLFRAARVEATCCDRGLCAAICPTGALRRETVGSPEEVQAGVALRFSALDCIDCGLCVKTCPEQALVLEERMDEGWRAVETVKRFEQRECIECGRGFTAVDGASTCQPCARSRELVRDVFRQRFPAFQAAQHEPPHSPQRNPNAAAFAHANRICSEEE
ncbi:4Fe-4S binding protein [Thauera sp.]|uniref:4Fe-4S binding protein n=1 Tax=Thauera sp. TaxID=1905334 RepID=UPI002C4130CD|nr:4Fe-4S binding protein [Thauera sp.]HRP23202.1 4Fe-4S binding protein [Thauera sp.]